MKRKLIAVMGIASPLLLLGCAAAVVLTSMACWFLLRPEEKSRIIKIIPLAPLATSVVQVAPGESTAGDFAPTAPQAPATEAVPEAAPIPLATTESVVEQALGFALPAGSVNSVTLEGVATRVVIPKLGVDAPVVLSPIQDQTWQVDHLGQAVGHLEGTAPPGSNSNIVLAGHVTLAAGVYGPFAGLGQLTTGDMVTVYYGDQAFNYMVDNFQTVDRTAIDVTYPTTTGQVTLITCNSWSSEEGRYLERLIVKGHLVN
jgi:LPXTG-site transpeptidase (sortase) family protein